MPGVISSWPGTALASRDARYASQPTETARRSIGTKCALRAGHDEDRGLDSRRSLAHRLPHRIRADSARRPGQADQAVRPRRHAAGVDAADNAPDRALRRSRCTRAGLDLRAHRRHRWPVRLCLRPRCTRALRPGRLVRLVRVRPRRRLGVSHRWLQPVTHDARHKAAFRHAARTSMVPTGAVARPSFFDIREADDRSAILESWLQHCVRSRRVDAIVRALSADILLIPSRCERGCRR
jgi:hypothetical protein